MCFGRFSEQLYTLRFSDPSGQEYRSIDHALFQSRQYIDPLAERLEEIRDDAKVTIESFDSDIDVPARELAKPIKVRFFLRGLSGSLRLRFPNIRYKKEVGTVEEQLRLFYRVVDIAENLILDADYYARMPRSLDELDAECGLFPDNVDLAKFREVLLSAPLRQQFFEQLDLNEPWHKWQPHLRAIDELLPTANVAEHVTTLGQAMIGRAPRQASDLLTACLADAKMHRVGHIVAKVLVDQIYAIPADSRAYAEASLLSWAMSMEKDTWGVDPDSNEIVVFNLRWKNTDLSLDALPAVLGKLMGLIHDRLTAANGDTGELLRCINWCVTAARAIPQNLPQLPPALRLIAEDKVPTSVAEGAKVLKTPVANLEALDDAVLAQFALPLWPYLTASRENGKITLRNSGIGVARAVRAMPSGTQFSSTESSPQSDLVPDNTIDLAVTGNPATLDVHFFKYGVARCIKVPIKDMPQAASKPPGTPQRTDGVYPPSTVVWRGGEHQCDLTRREMAFLQLGIVAQEVDVYRLMHPKNGLLWKERYLNAKSARDKISQFISRLNTKLLDAKPPLGISFSLRRDADSISRTDPANAPADSSLT